MFPIFVPRTSRSRAFRRQTAKFIGILISGILSLVLLLVVLAFRPAAPLPWIMIGIGALVAVVIPIIAVVALRNAREEEAAAVPVKRKRGLDGEDMYSLIDRLVDDLDDDEAAYLRRRLDNHERGLQREDTQTSIGDLLDDRETNSQEEWR